MMKKLTWVLLASMSLTLTFSTASCSSDNKDGKNDIFDSSSLIGEWYLSTATGFVINVDGSVNNFADTFTEDDAKTFMTFYENGNLFISTDEKQVDLKWELSSDKLKLTDPADGDISILTIKELSPTTLHYQIILLDEYVNNYTYTKIER